MRKGKLSREEAIKLVGEKAVEAVENENCDYTNRVQTDGDPDVEFSASVNCKDIDGDDCVLVAYYYQDGDSLEEVDELDQLNWEIHGYEVY